MTRANRIPRRAGLAVTAALLLALPLLAGAAQHMGETPSSPLEVRFQGDVPYVSGGVGDREQKAIERIAKDFTLRMTFAIEKGNYLGAGHVVITDAAGKTVVEADSRGPLFAADLPPGTYRVTASEFLDKPLQRTVEILPGERRVLHFAWEKK